MSLSKHLEKCRIQLVDSFSDGFALGDVKPVARCIGRNVACYLFSLAKSGFSEDDLRDAKNEFAEWYDEIIAAGVDFGGTWMPDRPIDIAIIELCHFAMDIAFDALRDISECEDH